MASQIRQDDRGNPYRRERIGGQLREVYLDSKRKSGLVPMQFSGLEECINKLRMMGTSINAIFRLAARRSGNGIKQKVKDLLKGRGTRSIHNGKKVLTYGLTGQLKKSIDVNVLTSRKGTVHAIIGANHKTLGTAFKKWHKPTRNDKAQKNVMVKVKPYKYWHLVEKGFTARIWRSGKLRPVPGRNYLGKVFAASDSQVMKDTKDVFQEQEVRISNKRQVLIEAL